jgi:hypothetical protein
MTKFWRDGFWRSSALGTVHWVEGHWVEREDWSRYDHAGWLTEYRQSHRQRLRDLGVTERLSTYFVNPNAECPFCGEPVFFYQNVFGSRVFFDELGPPWPKHPCLDNASAIEGQSTVQQPVARTAEAINQIKEWAFAADCDGIQAFKAAHGREPWPHYEVMRRLSASGQVLLILRQLRTPGRTLVYVSCKSLGRVVARGSIVTIRARKISFFDFSTMKIAEVQVEKMRGAAVFAKKLAGL